MLEKDLSLSSFLHFPNCLLFNIKTTQLKLFLALQKCTCIILKKVKDKVTQNMFSLHGSFTTGTKPFSSLVYPPPPQLHDHITKYPSTSHITKYLSSSHITKYPGILSHITKYPAFSVILSSAHSPVTLPSTPPPVTLPSTPPPVTLPSTPPPVILPSAPAFSVILPSTLPAII